MRAVELGEFLRSRRRRIRPSDAGFPEGERRREPGLRREEVAVLAGIAASWLARLEQGRARSVSPEVLAALARALRLDEAESDHLHALAGFRPERTEAAPAEVTAALRALLDELEPNPAYVLDRAWNIVAWNQAEARLFPGLLTASAPNLLELVFGDPDLQQLMVDHEEEQVRMVAQLRIHCTEWPDDRALAAVVDRLERTSPRFAQLWSAQDVSPFVTTRRRFDHPTLGPLELDHHRFAALDQPGTQLVVYTPARPA